MKESSASRDFHLRLGLAEADLQKLEKSGPAMEPLLGEVRRSVKRRAKGRLGKLTQGMMCLFAVCCGRAELGGEARMTQADELPMMLCDLPPPNEAWGNLEHHSGEVGTDPGEGLGGPLESYWDLLGNSKWFTNN